MSQMKLTLELNIDIDDTMRQKIAQRMGKTPEELTEGNAAQFLVDMFIKSSRSFYTSNAKGEMTTQEVQRLVYHQCRTGSYHGPIPMTGASDKELVELLNLPNNTVRWARHWLKENGFVAEGGKRTNGKFWVVTDKQIPTWLQEDAGHAIDTSQGSYNSPFNNRQQIEDASNRGGISDSVQDSRQSIVDVGGRSKCCGGGNCGSTGID